jgi:hypothetical protein
MTAGVIVQLPEGSLCFTQIFLRRLLPRELPGRKQACEGFDRIAELLDQQAQPMPLLRVHFGEFAAPLQKLLPSR